MEPISDSAMLPQASQEARDPGENGKYGKEKGVKRRKGEMRDRHQEAVASGKIKAAHIKPSKLVGDFAQKRMLPTQTLLFCIDAFESLPAWVNPPPPPPSPPMATRPSQNGSSPSVYRCHCTCTLQKGCR